MTFLFVFIFTSFFPSLFSQCCLCGIQIPIIMLVVEVPDDLITSASSNVQSPTDEQIDRIAEHGDHAHSDTVALEDSASPKCSQINYGNTKDVKSVRLDISFKSPSHTGLQTTELVTWIQLNR